MVNAKTALTAAHCCQLMESLLKQNEHWYDEILSKVTSRFSPLSLVAGEQTLSKEDGDEQVRHLFQNNTNVIRYLFYQCQQCGNFMILLSLRFYVKSIFGILEVQNLPF